MYHDLLIHCIIDLYNLFSTLLDLVPSPTCTLLVSTSFGLFPYFFLVSLPLLLCSPAVPVLHYFFPDSHPASLCHLFPVKMLSLQPPWRSSISLYFGLSSSISTRLPPNSLAPPRGYATFQRPFSAPTTTRSPLFLSAGCCL